MSEQEVAPENTLELGSISVSKEVVAIIAALETLKVKGVVGISSGGKVLSLETSSKKELPKSIEVWMKPEETVITIPIVTDYEIGVLRVAQEVQKRTEEAIKTMTGLKVLKIKVKVQGVKFKEEEGEEKREEKEKGEKENE